MYVSDPLATPIGALLCSMGFKTVYHEHDSPDGVLPKENGPRRVRRRMIESCRRRLARRTVACVVPNEGRASILRRSTSTRRPVIAVWNCPSKFESRPAPTRPTGGLRLFYQGSLVPARLPRSVIAALGATPEDVTLTVVGYETTGHRGYRNELTDVARKFGVENRVRFVRTLPRRREVFDLARLHDVGLALVSPELASDVNLDTMAGASNKAFDYMACGLALLVADLPDWRELYCDSGYGVVCDPLAVGTLAAVIGSMRDKLEDVRSMGERGRKRILNDWNYETRFQAVLRLLQHGASKGA